MKPVHDLIAKFGNNDKSQRNERTQRLSGQKPGEQQDRHAGMNVQDGIGQTGSIPDPLDKLDIS